MSRNLYLNSYQPGYPAQTQVPSRPKRYYIFDGDRVIGEMQDLSYSVAYTWGADGLASERIIGAESESLYYQYGPQGEARYLTDSTGAVAKSYLYNAYGKVLTGTGTKFNKHMYGGKFGYYSEGGMGLILAGQRWYSSFVMKWWSRDPIKYRGGDNLYEYVGGDPMELIDPDGTDWLDNISNYSSGFGDYVTFNGTKWIRKGWNDWLNNGQDPVDYNSPSYKNGVWTGVGWDCALAGEGLLNAGGREVLFRRYPNAGGGGVTLKNFKTGSRISLDFHRIGKQRVYRPHIDFPWRRHWPW